MKTKNIKNIFLVSKILCIFLHLTGLALGLFKKNWWLFISVLALHTVEALTIGLKTSKKCNISKIKSVYYTLLFGFTWWLPIIKNWIK